MFPIVWRNMIREESGGIAKDDPAVAPSELSASRTSSLLSSSSSSSSSQVRIVTLFLLLIVTLSKNSCFESKSCREKSIEVSRKR
jgi:hypothetical protein